MSKKDKGSKKAKSQGEVVTEAMANVTSNAEAAKAAIKAGKKLAKERIELEDPILALSAPRPVEIVEPQEPQRSVLTAYDKPSKKERKAEKAWLSEIHSSEYTEAVLKAAASFDEPAPTTTNGGTVELTNGYEPESELDAGVTTEAQGGVPSGTSAAPRTRTDNLLLLLKQAQESADLDNLSQLVECPRKYTTKNYGVQLVKKYAAEGINAEATEDTFIEPDRDHPKGMWQVTLRIKPNTNRGATWVVGKPELEKAGSSIAAELAQGRDIGGFEIPAREEEMVSTSDLPKPVVNPEKVKAPKSDKKKGKKGKK